MAGEIYNNYAQTTLSVAATNVDTTLSVVSVSGWPTTGNFRLRIDDAAPATTFEYVLATSVNVGANQVTVTRAQEGTSGIAHSIGAVVGNDLTAGGLNAGVVRLDTALSQSLTGPLVIPTALGGSSTATSYGSVPIKLAENLLGAGAASVSFSSIPATFRHLVLEWYARGDNASVNTEIRLRLNNDSAANYDWQGTYTASATTLTTDEALGAAQIRMGFISAATASANYFGRGVAEISHYAGTTGNKQVNSRVVWSESNSTGAAARMLNGVGKWRTAATAVNRVDFLPAAGNFIAGSLFTLWGLP